MGKTVKAKANKKRIVSIGQQALMNTSARTDEIHDMGENRLAAPLVRYAAAAFADDAAREKEAKARAAFLLADANSKGGVRLVKDTMWNLLERPRSSAQMDQAFPEGVDEYLPTPEAQPMMMKVLIARLAGVSSRKFTEEARDSLVKQLEDLRVKQLEELAVLQPLVEAALITRAEVKTSVALIRAGLLALKRDLQIAGLSEAKIHEIIPDASEPSTEKPTDDDGGGTDTGGSQGPGNNGNGSGSATA